MNFLQPLALSLSGLGLAQTLLGDHEQGIGYIERGLKIHRKAGLGWHLSTHILSKGICLYASGDLDQAKKILDEALKVSRECGEKHTEGKVLAWQGRVLGKRDEKAVDQAEEDLRGGLEIFETLKTKPDIAIGYLFLGEVQSRIGREEEAHEYLEKAEAMFREMGMDYWLRTMSPLLEGAGSKQR